MKQIIFYATTNTGKFDELKRYIQVHEPSIELKQFDQEIPEIQTTNQKAIAINKAEQAWNLLKKPVLVDDSGIYFDHYNNFPGTLSKFVFHGIGFEGLLKLADIDNRATKKLYMIYKDSNEGQQIFDGTCKGTIVRPESFQSHPKLPYDAIFMPAGADKTMAIMRGTQEEKKYSYRLQALKKFLDWHKKTGTA
jgi:non-canonical purine NTP pyrophosphatase (RdgB/HAM1 family)